MKVAIVLAILVSVSFAMIPWSFRYQSTANLWEDDYDLIFDPARIPEIEGSRVWTMLSNFVTGGEHLFPNNSVPFVLIGGSTHLGNFFPAGVADHTMMTEALWTGLGEEGSPLYGEGMITTTTWYDTDGDGVPDMQTIDTETRRAYEQTDESDCYVGLGYDGGGSMRFGLGVLSEGWTRTYTDPEYNFTMDFVSEDLPGHTETYIERSSSTGDFITSASDNEFRLSIWYHNPNSDWSVGLMGGYAMFNWDSSFVINGHEELYPYPDDTLDGGHNTTTDWIDSLNIPQSGSRIPVRLALFYDYSQTAQGRFWVGYTTQSHSYADEAVSFYNYSSQEIYSDFTYYDDTTLTTYWGEGSYTSISAGTHHLWNVTPRFNFGLGAIFSTSSSDDSVTWADDMVNVMDYDNGDTLTDINDYTATTRYSETWVRTIEGSSMSLTFPVGMEFWVINPKLALRLGATHRLTFPDLTTVEKMVDYTPQETITEYGDGTADTTYQDQGEIPGTESTQDETYSSTTYHFGAGWMVNKHLQLDFMGFTKLTDMTNWRLSATLHFD